MCQKEHITSVAPRYGQGMLSVGTLGSIVMPNLAPPMQLIVVTH